MTSMDCETDVGLECCNIQEYNNVPTKSECIRHCKNREDKPLCISITYKPSSNLCILNKGVKDGSIANYKTKVPGSVYCHMDSSTGSLAKRPSFDDNIWRSVWLTCSVVGAMIFCFCLCSCGLYWYRKKQGLYSGSHRSQGSDRDRAQEDEDYQYSEACVLNFEGSNNMPRAYAGDNCNMGIG